VTTGTTRRLSLEEEELGKMRDELALLQVQLAERELYLANRRAELAAPPRSGSPPRSKTLCAQKLRTLLWRRWLWMWHGQVFLLSSGRSQVLNRKSQILHCLRNPFQLSE